MDKPIHIGDFATVEAVLRDPGFSTFDLAGHLRHLNEHTPHELGELVHSALNNPFFLEGPRLRRLHQLVARMLSPARMPMWRPTVEQAVDKYLKRLELKTEADLVRDFVDPVFRTVMGAVLGFDSSDASEFTTWIKNSRDFLQPLLSIGRLKGLGLILAEITAHLEAAALSPPPAEGPAPLSFELLGHLSEDFTRGDAVQLIIVLMIVGQATPMTLANSILHVLRMPEKARAAATGPNARAWFGANLELLLRLCSAVRAMDRVALEPRSIGERRFEAGDILHLDLPSANHDAEVFAMEDGCPMTKRSVSANHLVFGSGRHTCPGAPLARLIIETALRRLFEAFPDITLAGEPSWDESIFLSAAASLPCKL